MDFFELQILFVISLGGFLGGFFLFWINQSFDRSLPPFHYDFSQTSTSPSSPPQSHQSHQSTGSSPPNSSPCAFKKAHYPHGTGSRDVKDGNFAQKDTDEEICNSKDAKKTISSKSPRSPSGDIVAAYRAAALSGDPFAHGLLPPPQSPSSPKYFLGESTRTLLPLGQYALFIILTIVLWELLRSYLFPRTRCVCRCLKRTQSLTEKTEKEIQTIQSNEIPTTPQTAPEPRLVASASQSLGIPSSPTGTLFRSRIPIASRRSSVNSEVSASNYQSARSSFSFRTDTSEHKSTLSSSQFVTAPSIEKPASKQDSLDTTKSNDTTPSSVSNENSPITHDIKPNVNHSLDLLHCDILSSKILDNSTRDEIELTAIIRTNDRLSVDPDKAMLNIALSKTPKHTQCNLRDADEFPSSPFNLGSLGSKTDRKPSTPPTPTKRDISLSPSFPPPARRTPQTSSSPLFPKILPPFVVTRKRRPTKTSPTISENVESSDESPLGKYANSPGSPPLRRRLSLRSTSNSTITPSPSTRDLSRGVDGVSRGDTPSSPRTPTRPPFAPLQPPFDSLRNRSLFLNSTSPSSPKLCPVYKLNTSDDIDEPPQPAEPIKPKFTIYTGDELSPVQEEADEPDSPVCNNNTRNQNENAIQRIRNIAQQRRLRRKDILPLPLHEIKEESEEWESSPEKIPINNSQDLTSPEATRPRRVRFASESTLHVYEGSKADNDPCMPTFFALSNTVIMDLDETTGEEIWRELNEEERIENEELHREISLELEELRRELGREGTRVWLKHGGGPV